MPIAPPTRCSEPYCGNLSVNRGKCEDHYVPWAIPSKRTENYSASDLARWSRAILRRDPVCRHCGNKPSVEADHIIPISRGGAGLDMGNGQGLCTDCHSAKTRREISENNRTRNRKPTHGRQTADRLRNL